MWRNVPTSELPTSTAHLIRSRVSGTSLAKVALANTSVVNRRTQIR